MSDDRVVPALVRLGRRIWARVFQEPVEREVEDELSFHVRMREEEHRRRGLPPAEARRRAVEGFGDLGRVKAECREIGERRERKMKRRGWWEALGQDVGFALRQVRRHPGFALVAVSTVAIAIGANAGVFSVVNGVLLRPLPYQEPEELVALWTRYLPRSGFDIPQFALSIPEMVDYRESSAALEGIGAYVRSSSTLTGRGGPPVRVEGAAVNADLLPLLGVRPALGRWFTEEEDRPGAAGTVILGDALWRGRFGGDPGIVGRSIQLSGRSREVIGVMPPEFVFPTAQAQLWLPLELEEEGANRAAHYINAVGRLAPGVTLAEAEAELETITAAWNAEYEHHAMGHFVYLRGLHEDRVGDVGSMLWLLLAAVGLVLLVGCANLANLFLARAEKRQRELGVRSALGAGGGRLARQLLTESLVLAALGSAVGLALGWAATRWLVSVAPGTLPRLEAVELDVAVLLFVLAVTVVTALLFGLAPAVSVLRHPAAGLGAGARETGGVGRGRFRRGLIAFEVAVSLVVVVGAGLVVRSFWQLQGVDPGVRTEGLLAADIQLPSSEYPEPEVVPAVMARILERVRALPGVEGASAVSALPLEGWPNQLDFDRPGLGRELADGTRFSTTLVYAQPGYGELIGLPLRRGRPLGESDVAGSEPVAVINREMAERYWPGEDPVGQRFSFPRGGDPVWIRVVGVVGNHKVEGLDDDPRPYVYLPHDQLRISQGSTGRGLSLVVSTAQPPLSLVPSLRAALAEVDPDLPLSSPRTLDDVVAASFADFRLTADLLAAFALVALLLAMIGIYGVVAYSVARRTREIGIRMALGAGDGVVLRLVLREGLAPALLGVGIGLVAAFWGTALLQGMLFRVSPTDPLSFGVLSLALLVTAALASWIPARRALRVPPTEALRAE